MTNSTSINNATIIAFLQKQFLWAIPLTWILSLLTIFGSAVIISYLKSKPLLSQSVMDFANKIFFIVSTTHSLLISIFLTFALTSSDLGEGMASGIGYTLPACVDIMFSQLCAIFIIQVIVVKSPEYLENNSFENIVKIYMSVVIPLWNGIFYTTLYFVTDPTGPVYNPLYITLRGINHPHAPSKLFLIRGITYLPIGFTSALNLLYTIRIQRDSFIQSNHVINTKVVLFTLVGQLIIAANLYAYAYFELLDNTEYQIVILSSLIMQVMKILFIAAIVLSHDSIRAHLSNLCLIRNVSILFSLRQVRQINVNQRDVELHSIESKF